MEREKRDRDTICTTDGDFFEDLFRMERSILEKHNDSEALKIHEADYAEFKRATED